MPQTNLAFDLNIFEADQIKIADEFAIEGRYVEAEEIYLRYLENDSSLLALATLYHRAERYELAFGTIKDCQTLPAKAAKAAISLALEKPDDSLKYMKACFDEAPKDFYLQYANTLHEDGKNEEAIKILEEYSDTLQAKHVLGQCYISSSEMTKAQELYHEAIKKFPGIPSSYCGLASSQKDCSDMEPYVCEMERIAASQTLSDEQVCSISSALGKVYESLSNYDRAFHHYKTTAEIEWKTKDYSDKVDWTRYPEVDKVTNHYSQDLIDRVPKSDKKCPLVFVVGMPRSGTTLTEQILISHSEIETKGETINISEEIYDIVKNGSPYTHPDEALEAFLKNRIGDIGGTYVVDKMPGNYHYLGMIYQLFPDAKFIYCKRDALDNCFSCYVTQFIQGHPYSYNFQALAHEYKSHLRYMAHWQKILPAGSIYQVDYEEMVADQEGQSKKLIEFLGLEWEDECNNFYKVKRNVKTASQAQVVLPIYSSSVKRADKFSKHLIELKEALENDS